MNEIKTHKELRWPFWGVTVLVLITATPVVFLDIPGYNSILDKVCSVVMLFALAGIYTIDPVIPFVKRWFDKRYVFALVRKQDPSPYEYLTTELFSFSANQHYRQRLDKYPIGQYVYILKDASVTGYCKIGKTNLPSRRIGRFDVILPFDIHILAIIPCDNASEMETYLHHKYERRRVNGEWFNLTGEDLNKILPLETMKAAGL